MLLYELPSTAAERVAWAEWDRNLPVMRAKYDEWYEARLARVPIETVLEQLGVPYDDNDDDLESD